MAVVVLIRHGATEWSAAGRHTSYTDLELTPAGEREASELAEPLRRWRNATVLTSPRQRAVRTAELAGFGQSGGPAHDDDLVEWDYGEYEGITTAEIRAGWPGWWLWTDGAPGGESPEQVQARIDRVLDRIRGMLERRDVVVFGHGHTLRVLGARWIDMPVTAGGRLRLDTGSISVLGFERETPVIVRWNQPVIEPADDPAPDQVPNGAAAAGARTASTAPRSSGS